LYQTEIKSWSSWAIGGMRLLWDADRKDVCRAARSAWDREFEEFYNNKSKYYRNAQKVNKVLYTMSVPKQFKGAKVEPLVIHWKPINPYGKENPMWRYPVSKLNLKFVTGFGSVNYFSVSLYFRKLLRHRGVKKEISIDLDMPQVEERLRLIKSLITS
jgi:hypothetical protein